MRIVVLDGYTLNPGDLNWEAFSSLGSVRVFDRTKREDVFPHLLTVDAVLTNKVVLDRPLLKSLGRLRYIGLLSTGINSVDLATAREKNIAVTNIPGYSTESVVQLICSFLLELTIHTVHHAETVRMGRWSSCPDFCYWDRPRVELNSLTLGVVGYGKIGKRLAEVAKVLGMKVRVCRKNTQEPLPEGMEYRNLEALFAESDVVSLCCPLTEETDGMVNKSLISRMKKSSILINTARGGLVVEEDLADALNAGLIAGAGLDVLSEEPPPQDHPLIGARNCLITPHIAWTTKEARSRLMNIAFENLKAFSEGRSENRVD